MREAARTRSNRRRRSALACGLVAFAVGAFAPGAAHARAFQVGCDEAQLRQALEQAGFNGEEDVLWLPRNCVYVLQGILIAYADDGFPITIEGNRTRISGQHQRTVLLVSPGATLYVNDTTFTEGKAGPTASGDGGAVYNGGALTLTRSTVSLSAANRGGGIYNAPDASLTLVESQVTANTAGTDGGGIHNHEGRLTLIDSTVTSNHAGGANGLGGGIMNDDRGTAERAVATLSNSTVSSNTSRFGAGIFNFEGRVTVSHSTLAFNNSFGGGNGAGIYHRGSNATAFFRLGNSIVSDNQGFGFDCVRDPASTAVITPTGQNLVEDGSCQIAGASSGDPKLGALTAGGAPYHPLLPGSPAIDAVVQLANCAGLDQRGAIRPKDGDANGSARCDLGAHEAP